MNVFQPGKVPEDVSSALIASAGQSAETVASKVEGRSAADIVGIFQRMLPPNIFDALTKNGEMLGIIIFSVLFGYCATRLPAERRDRVSAWWDDAYEVMIRMTDIIIAFTPIGVFALVSATVAQTGFAAFVPLAGFFGCVILGLAIHVFVTLPILMKMFGIPSWAHLKALTPALLTAFSTASSAATVPVTLECLQKRSGVSRRVAGFTVPLGATVNMDGTALYECAVVLFVAQIYGVELAFGTQVTIVVLALLTSIGVAGIPAASLVAIVVILGAVGLPLEAIGIVLAVDRVLDMARTTVNVYGDTVGAAIIARTEGETPYGIKPADGSPAA
jgi:Na+/H+-dicarboxylate symporter